MNSDKVRRLVWAALFTALTTISTMVISIPSPIGGNVNVGDALVILSAFLLGPTWGAFAAGIGSALADLYAYPLYAPATLIIKALMALTAGMILRMAKKKNAPRFAILASICAELIMIAGYFAYEALFIGDMGLVAALSNIPFNAIQGAIGAAAGTFMFYALLRIPYIKENF